MSRKKKIILSILSTITLFVFYNVWDWETNRHWIGTTKETEIVQQHLLPMEEYFPEGDWYVMCGDSPEDYFMVWTDFGLFGTHPTLRSGLCWTSSDTWVDNREEYIDDTVVPWLKSHGFTDMKIETDEDNEKFSYLYAEKWVNVSSNYQKTNDKKNKVQITFYVYARDNTYGEVSQGKRLLNIKVHHNLGG